MNLPLLPLRDIVVFPNMVIPLFVGRDKSINALNDVMSSEKKILLVTQKNSETDDPKRNDIFKVFSNHIVEILKKQMQKAKKEGVLSQNQVSKVTLPVEFNKKGDFFGLKIQGDSMIEAGINEGDTVIIKKTDSADNGQIVVALIDNNEAMLKRIRRKGNSVALESANKNYETKIFGPDRVKVQGILVSLYRNF